jgi:hypothetical protein
MGLEQLKAYVRLRVKTSKFKDFKGVRGKFPREQQRGRTLKIERKDVKCV